MICLYNTISEVGANDVRKRLRREFLDGFSRLCVRVICPERVADALREKIACRIAQKSFQKRPEWGGNLNFVTCSHDIGKANDV